MKPFRERNPIPIALISIGIMVLLILAAFNASSLPIIGGGPVYKADFTDAAGLVPNNDVDIAGVKVGTVTSVSLVGDVVQVTFRLNSGTWLGNQTTAAIKILTLLGVKYIDLDPQGTGQLPTGSVIPVSRTTTPLDVTTAFIGLARHIGAIDTGELAKAFDTIASTFSGTAPEVHGALVGLSRLSETVATRDVQLSDLLGHARNVTAVLASRDAVFTKLINDGDVVLQLVEQQAAVIHQLLIGTAQLATQLEALVQQDAAVIRPALANLHSVLQILGANENQLEWSIHLLAPFVRDFDNTLGNGRWFDTFVADLPIPPGVTVQKLPGGLG
jgi:phospholipid/cholesterol/gamma-HCH transport system substrate-binding protein